MKQAKRLRAFNELVILRNKNISLLEKFTEEQAEIIPQHFSNNLFWQAGHLLTTQMSLLYRRSNLEMPLIDTNYLAYFSKGTSPAVFDTSIPSYELILSQLSDSLDILQADMERYADEAYSEPVLVSYGMTLNSFHDALLAIPYHEAYHMQAINLLIKQINN